MAPSLFISYNSAKSLPLDPAVSAPTAYKETALLLACDFKK